MLLDWSVVPQRFHYLNNVVLEDRRDELGIALFDPESNRHVSLGEKLTSDEIATLTRVHMEICDREDNAAILDWLDETKGGTEAQIDAAWRIRSMLRLLNDLARHGVDPFTTEVVVAEKPRPAILDDRDRQTVPEELVPFLEFVGRWGVASSDTERYILREKVQADPQKLTELQKFVDSWTRELATIYDGWADRESMTKNRIVAQFYFTFLLTDELGIKPTKVEEPDRVAQLISNLEQFGSKRKDSGRMWAARTLPECGDDAVRAIPWLENALDDPVPSVRVWAHCALARLVGDVEKHREVISDIGHRCIAELDSDFEREFLQLGIEAALDTLAGSASES